jgi:hypothetical protein
MRGQQQNAAGGGASAMLGVGARAQRSARMVKSSLGPLGLDTGKATLEINCPLYLLNVRP